MQDVGSGCPKNDLIDKGTFKLGTLEERKTSKVLLSRFDFSFSPENLHIKNTSNDHKYWISNDAKQSRNSLVSKAV